MNQNIDELLRIYENCFKSRYLDERLQYYYYQRDERGFGHVRTCFSGIGNEVGPSIISYLLKEADLLIPRYRGYAALFGKDVPVHRIAGEMFRKKSGTAKGIGDTSAFRDEEHNVCGYSTILGTNFSIAIGLAFAVLRKKEKRIVTIFFGDGEASRSTFGSALNLASLWELPILFVCENNGASIEASIHEMSATKTIAERASGYGLVAETIPETDGLLLYQRAKTIIELVRETHRPFLLEIIQKRFTTHSSKYDTAPFLGAMISPNNDPLLLFENLLKDNGVRESVLLNIKESSTRLIDEAVATAKGEEKLSPTDFYSIFCE